MIKKHLFYSSLVFTLAFAVLALGFNVSKPEPVTAVEGTYCGSNLNIVYPDQGSIISNIVPIDLAGVELPNNIASVRFKFDGQIIGRGFQEPDTGSQWSMIWDTRFTESGEEPNSGGSTEFRELKAVVKFIGGESCETAPVSINVFNPIELKLDEVAELIPGDWSGLTNTIALFNIDYNPETGYPPGSNGDSPYISKYADVMWQVSGRGTVTPEPYSRARYSAGPATGTGLVKAFVSYGGGTVELESQTLVYNQDNTAGEGGDDATQGGDDAAGEDGSNGTTGGDNTTTDETLPVDPEDPENTEEGDTTTTDTTNITEGGVKSPKTVISQILAEDEFTKNCLVNKLGEDEVNQLVNEDRRPKASEFKAFYSCFARQRYVLPSILAPVAPEEITQKEESEKVNIENVVNEKKILDADDTERTVLVLSGKAEPNSTVLIYVFSEPLVLVAFADEDGNWTYTLEDPLESGNHEVYALVDRGDGEYERSSVASFVVGEASASAENPNGYSLELIEEPSISVNNRSLNQFVAATVGITALASAVLVGFTLIKSRRNKSLAGAGNQEASVSPKVTESSDQKQSDNE